MTSFEQLKQALISDIHRNLQDCDSTKSMDELLGAIEKVNRKIYNFYSEQKELINKFKFESYIQYLNEKEILSQQDLFDLRMGRDDDYSRIRNTEDLKTVLLSSYGEEDIEIFMGDIMMNVPQSHVKYTHRALRWIARGLNVEHAIAKVNFDIRHYEKD